MVDVYLLTTDPASDQVARVCALLSDLQKSFPHHLNLIDLRDKAYFRQRKKDALIVVIDDLEVREPENPARLREALSEALLHQNSPDYRPAAEKDRLSGRERFSLWFSSHYLGLINAFLTIYVLLPVLAPVLMKLNLPVQGRAIYRIYAPLCHQLAYRSFFLFGRQFYYPLESQGDSERLTYTQISGNPSDDLAAASDYIGDELAGYKIAFCQRDLAIYGGLLLFGIFFALIGRKVKPLAWWLWVILAIGPMGLDGVWQLLSNLQLPFLEWLPVHESNPLLRVLTGGSFGWFTAWFGIPTIEEGAHQGRFRLEAKAAIEEQTR